MLGNDLGKCGFAAGFPKRKPVGFGNVDGESGSKGLGHLQKTREYFGLRRCLSQQLLRVCKNAKLIELFLNPREFR